jgi:hypothetical protein
MAKKLKPMPVHSRALLHREISEKVSAMIERAGHLRDTGKLEARKLLARIEKLTEELKELE